MTTSLSVDSIFSHCLGTPAARVQLEIVDETQSTNSDLLARVSELPIHAAPILLIASKQTSGRGRAGRVWHSDDQGLTFSLAWPIRQARTELRGLPLAVGVVLAQTVQAIGINASLKWPNDVLLDGRKLAGILVETRDASTLLHSATWAVIGIGINFSTVPASVKDGTGGAALPTLDRHRFIAQLLVGLVEMLQVFERNGFSQFTDRWNALHAHQGQVIDILDNGCVLHTGLALGVDQTGQLLVRLQDKTVSIMSGDVSLRVSKPLAAQENHNAVSC